MKITSGLRLVLAAGLTLGALPQAFAVGTAAGTLISNTASVDYVVGGVNQPDVFSNNGVPTTFIVDRRINLTVAEVGGVATDSVPGSTEQVLTFTVANDSNSVLDFRLFATQDAGGATTFADTDTFDVELPAPLKGFVFVDDGNGIFDPALDTATFIDELAPNAIKTVFIVARIPAALPAIGGVQNGDTAGLTLTAVAAQSIDGTGAYVATPGVLAANADETVGVDSATFVDTVFGDAAGDGEDPVTGVGNGRHSDDDEYDVVTAAIAVTKSSRVVWDPFNLFVNPKSIPGAIVEYCLDVKNTGSAAADTIILTDSLAAMLSNIDFVPGSIKSASTSTPPLADSACDLDSGTIEDDNTTDADDTVGDGGNYSGTTVTVTTPSIAADSRFKAIFRVKVKN